MWRAFLGSLGEFLSINEIFWQSRREQFIWCSIRFHEVAKSKSMGCARSDRLTD
jgi:hypothetical protein